MNEPSSMTHRRIEIEFLYLDLTHCTRCIETRQALADAIDAVRPALSAMTIGIGVTERHVDSAEMARRETFIASPTIRIDGRDIQPEAFQNACADCGELCGCAEGVDCRVWEWEGQRHTVPPMAFLVAAILGFVERGDQAGEAASAAPETREAGSQSMERFFAGKAASEACCAQDCCS